MDRPLKRPYEQGTKLSISFSRETYQKNFPNFQKPKILGDFSVDGSRRYCGDRSQLKFFNEDRFKKPGTNEYDKVNLNLNSGMNKVVRKGPGCKDEKIDHMLRWILQNRSVFHDASSSKLEFLPVDFVCFRGLLVALMTTLYENSNDWEVWAIKFRGTIYLCAKETKIKQERESRVTERDQRMSSWGYKFEQYMQTDHPSSTKAQMTSEPHKSRHTGVNENEEFCCMFKSRLGSNAILFGAEMDGYQLNSNTEPKAKKADDLNLSSDGHFIEMKTSRLIENDRQHNTFCRFKTQKWWAQSFMVGIPKIICGFRDDDGFVRKLKEFKIEALPKMAENPFWLPNVCMNFLNELLTSIKMSVKHDLRVYKFIYPLKSSSIIVREDPEETGFLPDWYLDKVFSEV